jgi:anti-sigma factor RsiW
MIEEPIRESKLTSPPRTGSPTISDRPWGDQAFMVPDQQRLSIDERANLVAYLDGELNDAQARSIATKLTQSLTARREVEALQKTWEMLDLLPRPKASEDFTARTLSVATQQGDGRIASAASDVARRIGTGLAWAVASALLFVTGYLLTSRVWPNPSARLARDLPIAESLDEYRDVGSFEFLQQLDESSEFN